jgi:methyl-accepting chemotaxis protein
MARIYLGFGTLMALGLAVAAFGVWQLSTVSGQVGRLTQVSENTVRMLEVGKLLETIRRAGLRYKTVGGDDPIKELTDSQSAATDLLAAGAKAARLDERRRVYEEVRGSLGAYRAKFDSLVQTGTKMRDDRKALFAGGDELTAATARAVDAARATGEPGLAAHAASVEAKILLVRVANWRFLATVDPKGPDTFRVNVQNAKNAIGELEKDPSSGPVQPLLAGVKTALGAYVASFEDLSSGILKSEALFEGEMVPLIVEMQKRLAAVKVAQVAELGNTKTATEETIATSSLTQEALAVVALVLGAALAFTIGRSIARPVIGMTSAMGRLAAGDKAVVIPAKGNRDEIGEMAEAVEVFRQGMIKADELTAAARDESARQERRTKAVDGFIAAFDTSVTSMLGSLGSAAAEMQASSETMRATADESSQQSAAVAAAADQALANVQTVAAASEELSASITEISRQVAHSASIAGRAVEDAGRTDVTVRSLADAATKIGDVVKLISGIASQTNLLALNATIEAARAGEMGKGFAVVATEVKSLANQTAQATEEISAQITAMQAITEQAVTAIREIGGTIGQMNEISTSVASAVEEQGAATQEITRNTQEAAKGTAEVTANIAGVSQGASETGAAAEQVLTAAGGLGRQAEALRGEVDHFLANIRAA